MMSIAALTAATEAGGGLALKIKATGKVFYVVHYLLGT